MVKTNDLIPGVEGLLDVKASRLDGYFWSAIM